jgi:hypothetical protein
MTFRDRLADWITGGALTEAREQIRQAEQDLRYSKNRGDDLLRTLMVHHTKANARKDLLDRIAAMETPNANATVRRMARIARGEE